MMWEGLCFPFEQIRFTSYLSNHFRAAVRALIAVCEVDSSIVTLLGDKFR